MEERAYICVFVKPPRPGHVKTRLIPALGAEQAAHLAEAFFRDTWNAVSRLDWAHAVATSTGPLPPHLRALTGLVWRQGEGDLGARLERVLRRALRHAPFAIALGADAPGIPLARLEAARRELRRNDAVLGPCQDGGFYLLGLRRCPRGLLAGLPWSRRDTFAHTLARLRERRISTRVLEPYFDLDHVKDLARLRSLLATGKVHAPETALVLRTLRPA
ncbi:MAG: TIGR04282 family arsenosugar biosynthesis glycosyltransferase [Acidobacteria bacterium]|nr:TIGR04282 family arsenosugar biosynthesis glycosyltransferase [Acidobacteriota bacterium]